MWRLLFRTKTQTEEASGGSVGCVCPCVSATVADNGVKCAAVLVFFFGGGEEGVSFVWVDVKPSSSATKDVFQLPYPSILRATLCGSSRKVKMGN